MTSKPQDSNSQGCTPVTAIIVAAMADEAAPYLAAATSAGPEHQSKQGDTWWRSLEIEGRDVVLACCGIGLVNAVATVAPLLSRFSPTALISTGSAGGVGAGICVGNIIVGDRYRYHSADACAFGYQLGQIPGMPADYGASKDLLALFSDTACTNPEFSVRVGTIASGDIFINDQSAPKLLTTIDNLLAVDMESAALAQLAWRTQVPFVSVRAISDLASAQADTQFGTHLDGASKLSASLVLSVIPKLNVVSEGDATVKTEKSTR